MVENWDFCGWATRNGLRCSDGRIIRQDAFAEDDGKEVPIVWMHQHNNINNVLGRALLHNRPEGVYTYGKFNDTYDGKRARELVQNGDITNLSICANNLVHDSDKGVLHGVIREVSLVLSGANPGACIEYVGMAHGDGCEETDEAIIFTDEALTTEAESFEENEMNHSAEREDNMTNKEDTNMASEEMTVRDVLDSMNEEQKNVLYYLLGEVAPDEDDDDEEDDEGMMHSVFDDGRFTAPPVLSDEDVSNIFQDAKRLGSLRDSVLMHMDTDDGLPDELEHASSATYGIENIGYLFPDAQTIGNVPSFVKRDDDWVSVFMSGSRHSPFSRVKSVFADITEPAARAKGYLKGKLKKEEVFSLLKRSTDPQTVYKKQKLDRDDVVDITSFDVVAWIKGEMRMMLNEELARAGLVGDGRLSSDDDKIQEDHIRPIYNDSEFYTIRANVTPTGNAGVIDTDASTRSAIRAFIKKRKDYKGSGNLTMFTTEDFLSDMLLLEDEYGRSVYPDIGALARKLRVNRIVSCPVMENLTTDGKTLLAIAVDLSDYNFGADKGGAVSMFDDFDIDYNQQKYLIETRCSGALIRPYSAIVLEMSPLSTSSDPGSNIGL